MPIFYIVEMYKIICKIIEGSEYIITVLLQSKFWRWIRSRISKSAGLIRAILNLRSRILETECAAILNLEMYL